MREIFWMVEYLASFIEIFMSCYFCGTFILKSSIEHVKRKAALISAVVAIFVFFFNHIQLVSSITAFLFLILSSIIQWICYKRKYLLSIGLIIAYLMLVMIIDFIVIYLVASATNMDTGYIVTEQSLIRFACILLSKCLLIVVVTTINRLISRERSIPALYMVLMGGCSAFLLLSGWGVAQISFRVSDGEINTYTILFFLASLGIEMIVFFLVLKIAEGYEQKQTSLLMEFHNRMLQKSLDETERNFELWRQSIHDHKNHMIALMHLAEEGKLDEIKSYIQKENEFMDKKLFYIKTGNAVVDAVIYSKQKLAEKQNITFVVNAVLPEKIVVNDIDLANILGNLMDNAIEAGQKEEEPYVQSILKQRKDFFVINIKNKCTKLEKAEVDKTTKADAAFHGIGIKSVKKLVKKYDGEISLDVMEQEFVVNIVIPNKVE